MADQARNQEYTIAFLRLTAVEMGHLAKRAPEIAGELRHIARQLQREADDLDTPDTK
jgi:hypothetical protein